MLSKHPKPFYRRVLIKGAVILFVAEAAAFVGCYGIWHKLNSDRDFRNTVREKYPFALEYFYKIGETLSDNNIRKIDYEYWESQAKLKEESSIGYVLLVAATPSEKYLADVKKTYPGVEKSKVESIKKKQQFVNVLEAVTETNHPLHRLKKTELEDLSNKK